MNILVINCGSSSLKFLIASIDPETTGEDGVMCLARGIIERIGGAALLTFQREGKPVFRHAGNIADHEAAVRRMIEWVDSANPTLVHGGMSGISAVGHRVVHGGERFNRPTVIDESVTFAIDSLEYIAPLHNPPSLAGIHAARAVLGPLVPMVAVFDTAFHATLPERASRYAIPYELSLRHGIRRYGFHGISYQYLLSRYCNLTETPLEKTALIAFHLGNGCSAVAVKGGVSIDTSMGFTPLEGLVMGTRSGDIDPAIFSFLAREEGLSAEEVEQMLNKRSGLHGLSGQSRDMRDLLERERYDPRVRLAVEIFCYRAKKYLGAYLAALGGAEAILFSGGIGENSPEVRARICEGMEWCGVLIDPLRNKELIGQEGEISSEKSRVRVFVIPTDEELIIARETAACIMQAAVVSSLSSTARNVHQ